MPHYFFDMVSGEAHHVEDKGIDLPDAATARDTALKALADIAQLDIPFGGDTTTSILARRGDVPIYRATATLTVECLHLDS